MQLRLFSIFFDSNETIFVLDLFFQFADEISDFALQFLVLFY